MAGADHEGRLPPGQPDSHWDGIRQCLDENDAIDMLGICGHNIAGY